MQAREGAQAAVVPAGAQLVAVGPTQLVVVGPSLLVVAGQHCWWWWGLVVVGQRGFLRGEGERSLRMNVILFLRPLIIKKTVRSSAGIYMYVTDSMIKFFFTFFFFQVLLNFYLFLQSAL